MITRDALYDFIDTLIDNAGEGTPLENAVIFPNIRGSVDDADKVVRVECFNGNHAMTDEDRRKELRVQFTIQCWVKPTGDDLTDIDTAVDLSFEMSRTIFRAIASDTSLNNKVCDCYADEFETGEANLGATRRGVTFLDGTINEAS